MSCRAPHRLLFLTALLVTAVTAPAAETGKPDSATAAALKKITERYARTKEQIATLLEPRTHPSPLPTSLPNPFYHSLDVPVTDTTPVKAPEDIAPAAADSSDSDTLAKYVYGLKLSGVVVRNGQPHLTINSLLCKVGDVIPVGTKDRPIYLQVVSITPDELTLSLNEARQVVRLKR
jgi:hypothetical protein